LQILSYRPAAGGKAVVDGGDSASFVVEFGPSVKARVRLNYGNWTQASREHFHTQLDLLAQRASREALLSRLAVEKNTVFLEDLSAVSKNSLERFHELSLPAH
jgi:hypothetical protein